MKVLLLAAGRGERLRPLTERVPKPMIPIGGEPLLKHQILLLKNHGIREIFINLFHRQRVITDYFGNGEKFGVKINYFPEEILLGTAGTALKLRDHFPDRFLVLYGDNFTNCNLADLMEYHHRQTPLGTIAVFDRDQVPNSGMAGGRVLLSEKGEIKAFQEGGGLDSPWVNAGIYVLEPSIFNFIPDKVPCDFGKDVFGRVLQERKRLAAFPLKGYLFGIDTPQAYQEAEEYCNDHHTNAL